MIRNKPSKETSSLKPLVLRVRWVTALHTVTGVACVSSDVRHLVLGSVSVQEPAAAISWGRRRDGSFGAFSGSGKLEKGSLSAEIQKKLNEEGVVVIPLPHEAVKKEKLDMKGLQAVRFAGIRGKYRFAGHGIR